MLLGSVRVKAVLRMLMKLTPGLKAATSNSIFNLASIVTNEFGHIFRTHPKAHLSHFKGLCSCFKTLSNQISSFANKFWPFYTLNIKVWFEFWTSIFFENIQIWNYLKIKPFVTLKQAFATLDNAGLKLVWRV